MRNQHKGSGRTHGGGYGSEGKGGGGYCVCPKCGYSVAHEAGIPCKTMFCKDCNVSLQRSETPGKDTGASQELAQNESPDVIKPGIQFPRVDSEKCTACGICIDICPTGTIVVENGKAFVKIDNCRNCRICIKACPEDAFILE
ncbi:MAG: 4Fe-4S binding protein [Lentimicrobium sp.]|nr:4Fe-4S binding protein [Lentimicrobium sp.]